MRNKSQSSIMIPFFLNTIYVFIFSIAYVVWSEGFNFRPQFLFSVLLITGVIGFATLLPYSILMIRKSTLTFSKFSVVAIFTSSVVIALWLGSTMSDAMEIRIGRDTLVEAGKMTVAGYLYILKNAISVGFISFFTAGFSWLCSRILK